MKKYLLNEMTWKEAEETFEKTDMAIIPTGAIHPHGLGCPLGIDNIMAQEFANRIAEKTDVVVLPVISYGYTQYHGDFPGCISVGRSTYYHLLLDICKWLHKWGIKKIVYMIGHGGDMPQIQEVAHYCRYKWNMLSASIPWWSQVKNLLGEDLKCGNSEGLTDEMSALLYVKPDLVHVSRETFKGYKQTLGDKFQITGLGNVKFKQGTVNIHLRNKDVSDTGGFGPSESTRYVTDATAELGERMVTTLVNYIVDFIEEFRKVKIPSI